MIRPALTLDFLAGSIDPRVSFTRSGVATRVNSSGFIESVATDTPRFDYDPTTLQPRGFLIEEARTNVFLYSEDLSNAAWNKSSTTINVDAVISPDGTQNADQVNFGATVNAFATQAISPIIGAVTFSFWARTDTPVTIRGRLRISGSSVAAPPISIGTSWQRFSISYTGSGTGIDQLGLQAPTTGLATTIFVWGMQAELGSTVSSYIKSEGTQGVRGADIALITGTNFSDFWQTSKGGAQVQAIPSTVSGIRPLVQYDDGTADNIITLRGNAANPELQIVDGGAPQVQLDAGTIVANAPYKLFGVWNTDDCAVKLNNEAKVFDASATIPTVTQARIGSDGTNYLNGHLVSLDYYTGDQIAGVGRYTFTRRKNKVIPPPIF